MTDVILSSFISLFALFGKEEQVDESRAKEMLVNYLRRHFGVRNTDVYIDLYDDMRMAYDMADNIDSRQTVTTICNGLQGEIRSKEKSLLLLRLMEFCGYTEGRHNEIFRTMQECFGISDEQFRDFRDFVSNKTTEKVMIHKFLLWKTNKEKSGRYPAYIIYHTDYSSARKEMIKRDMMYSSDEQQIRELLANEIAANVKKGWEEIIKTTKAA